MGRAERRRQERQQRIMTKRGNISLSPYELRQIKRQTVNDIATFDVEILLTCFASVMNEQMHLDPDDIMVNLQAVDEKFGEILSGELSAQEMKQKLIDETGIRVKYSKDW